AAQPQPGPQIVDLPNEPAFILRGCTAHRPGAEHHPQHEQPGRQSLPVHRVRYTPVTITASPPLSLAAIREGVILRLRRQHGPGVRRTVHNAPLSRYNPPVPAPVLVPVKDRPDGPPHLPVPRPARCAVRAAVGRAVTAARADRV